ncbi:hypothetical protein [uncultured Chloroflexus sp.]|uniref:hypothetical protein n=1 Tax=uncultured Chloroflexus sp. TaxID=214040 RepID=UPI002637FCD1|nr:hypothetical protein [uncultured Chloroflexus sp.]
MVLLWLSDGHGHSVWPGMHKGHVGLHSHGRRHGDRRDGRLDRFGQDMDLSIGYAT